MHSHNLEAWAPHPAHQPSHRRTGPGTTGDEHARGRDLSPPQRQVPMGMLDRLVSSRISLVLSPLEVPNADRLRAALLRLAAEGIHTRVGLVLGEGESWVPLGADVAHRLEDIVRVAPDGVTDLRGWIEDTWIDDLPLQFAIARDRIAFVADHRLMDGVLAVALIPTLYELAAGRRIPAPLARRPSGYPLVSSLTHTFLRRPRTALDLVRHLRRHPALAPREAATVPAVPPAEPWGPPRTAHLIGHFAPHVLDTVRRWDAGRAGITAGLLLLVSQALRESGLPVAPEAIMVVNLRRYLPSHASTLGNFITGITVPVSGPLAEPSALGSRISESLQVARPLLGTALTVTKGHALQFLRAGRESPPPEPAPISGQVRATVSFSFSGRWRMVENLPWRAAPRDRIVEPLGDVTADDGIGFLACSVDRRLRIGTSFRADRIDEERVRAALDAIGSRTPALLAALDAR